MWEQRARGFRGVGVAETSTPTSSPAGEPDPLARTQLRALPQVVLVDDRHHRIAAGRRVVGEEHHRPAVRRHLDGPEHHPLARQLVGARRGAAGHRPVAGRSGRSPARRCTTCGTAGRARRRRTRAARGTRRHPQRYREAGGDRGVSTASGARPARRRAAGRPPTPGRPDPSERVGRARAEHRLDGDATRHRDVGPQAGRGSPAAARLPRAADRRREVDRAAGDLDRARGTRHARPRRRHRRRRRAPRAGPPDRRRRGRCRPAGWRERLPVRRGRRTGARPRCAQPGRPRSCTRTEAARPPRQPTAVIAGHPEPDPSPGASSAGSCADGVPQPASVWPMIRQPPGELVG